MVKVHLLHQKNKPLFPKSFHAPALKDSWNYIKCKHCGNIIDLRKAKVSGYNSENSLRHIHCSRCGKIVMWSPEERNSMGIIQGVCWVILGVALAYILYPHIDLYGLQAGFFTSMFGFLKIIIS